ncbi:MAG TPA: hypothetical protein VFY39_10295 [Gammaproteobacteria bacterium]|nr:hypothetical protein [Gammaproteobacteria bacterium]
MTAIWQSPEVAAQAPDPSAAPVAPAARPDLAPQLKELRESTAELNLGRDASPQEAAQLQARLASRQRRLGRKQGELGRQQAELARKAQQELDELLRQAVGSGLAQRAPGD